MVSLYVAMAAQALPHPCVLRAEKKTESLKAQHKQEMAQRLLQEVEQAEKAKARISDAHITFEAWKKNKERSALEFEQLGPDAEPLHERAWCPARSITHSYPSAEKVSKNSSQSQSGKASHSPIASPSQSSKASRSRHSSHSESNQSTTSSLSRPPRTVSSPMQSSRPPRAVSSPMQSSSTARKKTIQVCCQTLEYWCTCKDDIND